MLDIQRGLKRRRRTMLNFPNQSRVFDPTRRAVRFWGHDGAMEWSFFVTEDALKRLQPKYVTLWKWSNTEGRFMEYMENGDDDEFFYRRDFCLRQTPHTDPKLQELAALFPPAKTEQPKKHYGF